jgi:hypothetical protein
MKERITNPWRHIERVWRATERIVVVFSIATVVGTFGYVSIHAFV